MNHSRLKRGIEFIAFMAIILFVFVELTWLLRANQDFSRVSIYGFQNQKDLDVVLVGASSVHCYYEPLEAWDKKGFTSYNYSTGACPADLLKYYLEAVRRKQDAQLYVCDLRTLPLADEFVYEAAFRNWSDSLPVLSPARYQWIASYLSGKNRDGLDILSYFLDIGKYHSNYSALNPPYDWSVFKRLRFQNTDKGFFYDGFNDHSVPYERPVETSARGELTDYQEKTLNELLDYCDREELPVLFIVCPYILSDSDWQLFNRCGDIIRARGYSFVNFNEYYDEIGLDFETDFGNSSHVNFVGVEKYTNYLMDYLDRCYDLPDHRGDPAYSSWDADYREFAKKQDEWRQGVLSMIAGQQLAKRIGERLPQIDDPAAWLSLVRNDNFTLIIEKDRNLPGELSDALDGGIYHQMLKDWDIAAAQENYIGVWNGSDCLFHTDGADSYEGEIGVKSGRKSIPCAVNTAETPSIQIDGVDYYRDCGGIQVVVFDNNYLQVVDSVSIIPGEAGIRLVRE